MRARLAPSCAAFATRTFPMRLAAQAAATERPALRGSATDRPALPVAAPRGPAGPAGCSNDAGQACASPDAAARLAAGSERRKVASRGLPRAAPTPGRAPLLLRRCRVRPRRACAAVPRGGMAQGYAQLGATLTAHAWSGDCTQARRAVPRTLRRAVLPRGDTVRVRDTAAARLMRRPQPRHAPAPLLCTAR